MRYEHPHKVGDRVALIGDPDVRGAIITARRASRRPFFNVTVEIDGTGERRASISSCWIHEHDAIPERQRTTETPSAATL